MPYQLLSASGGERANLCPGSFALDYIWKEAGFFADRGTFIHKYLEKSDYDPDDALQWLSFQNSAYNTALAESIDTVALARDLRNSVAGENEQVIREQMFLLESDGVQMVSKKQKSRDYGSLSGFGGTADWIKVTDTHVGIFDYKTGTPVKPDCEQMKILAYFASQIWTDREVITGIVMIPVSKFPARSRAKWSTHKTPHEILPWRPTKDEVEACGELTRDIYSRVQEQRLRRENGLPVIVTKGDKQCKYCNQKPKCPAHIEEIS